MRDTPINPPITTYSSLLARLKVLPSPPPNTVRVYRGQTNDYPQMMPSGLRQAIRNRKIWLAYSSHLHADLLPEAIRAGDATIEMLQAFGVWLQAVAQHYGPGSEFVDVTYSIEVALWFALNAGKVLQAHGAIGPPGPPDPAQDHPTEVELLSFQPWTEPASLYVFDLPKWNGKDFPPAASVVDLADAPLVFSSARMRAQSGCLVYCRDKNSQPVDLKNHLVSSTPISVSRPMQDAPGLDRRVADLFPSPEKDPWYARLLSVPMTYAPKPLPPALRRSIPVTVYFDEKNRAYTEEVHFRDVALPLPLLHRAFQNFGQPDTGSKSSPTLPRGVPIILEAPLIFPNPPGDSELWHHGILARDIPDQCPVYDFGSAAPSGEVPLSNVLLEFSLLENTGWDHIVKASEPIRVLRGVWLRREAEGFAVAFIYQDVPGDQPEVVGFFPLRFDPKLAQFAFFHPAGEKPSVPISGEPVLAKHILIALMLLRELSPVLKAEAVPRLAVGLSGDEKGKPSTEYLVAVKRDAAKLFRVAGTPPYGDWFVVRDASNPDEPFTQSDAVAGSFQLVSDKPFREIPIDAITSKFRG